MKTKKKGLCIELTQGQYDHLYNIMCSQDEIIDYLNESDDFDPQTFDNLFDNICAAKGTYLSNSVIGAQFMKTKAKTTKKFVIEVIGEQVKVNKYVSDSLSIE